MRAVTNLSSENNFAIRNVSAPPTQETADVGSPEEGQEKGPLVVIPYVAGADSPFDVDQSEGYITSW